MSDKPGTFKPGQSGNPGGRSKAAERMAKLIREKTDDGTSLVDYAISVLTDAKSKPTDRAWACEWLADRGFGKAQQFVEVSGDSAPAKLDLSRLTGEQLVALAAAIAAMKGGGQ